MDAAAATAVTFVFSMLIGLPIVLGAIGWMMQRRGPREG